MSTETATWSRKNYNHGGITDAQVVVHELDTETFTATIVRKCSQYGRWTEYTAAIFTDDGDTYAPHPFRTLARAKSWVLATT